MQVNITHIPLSGQVIQLMWAIFGLTIDSYIAWVCLTYKFLSACDDSPPTYKVNNNFFPKNVRR